MAIWNRLTAFVTGGAVATAAADALAPEFEVLKQTAWANEPHRTLAATTAAELRARETVDTAPGIDLEGVDLSDDAARAGVGSHRFNLLTELARTTPSVAQLITLRRRGIATDDHEGITASEFRHLLRRQGYAAAWITDLEQLLWERLDMGQIPAAIHRGLIPSQGLLLGKQPEPPFKVAAYPEFPIDAVAEAESHGIDKERLGVLVGLQGFPMGVIEAAQALFRGDITYGDYIRAFNTSNSRNEWADAVLAYARQIPTARDYIENALRGYRTLAKAQEGAARHGMSAEDALLIFQNSGRPLNLHQITQALAWGGKYDPAAADNSDPWVQAVLLGAVRPEYYDLQEHLKYTLPSALYFRTLQQQNVLTEAEAVTWYKRLGWPPDLAAKVAAAYAKTSTAKTDPYVSKADTQLWNTLHRSYVAGESDDQTVLNHFVTLEIDEAARPQVLLRWAAERALAREQLTPAQVKKALDKEAINPATGVAWTRSDAITALLGRGYSLEQAEAYLNIPAGQ